jgi:hypothetical protein
MFWNGLGDLGFVFHILAIDKIVVDVDAKGNCD